jgi:hypothetical protein
MIPVRPTFAQQTQVRVVSGQLPAKPTINGLGLTAVKLGAALKPGIVTPGVKGPPIKPLPVQGGGSDKKS